VRESKPTREVSMSLNRDEKRLRAQISGMAKDRTLRSYRKEVELDEGTLRRLVAYASEKGVVVEEADGVVRLSQPTGTALPAQRGTMVRRSHTARPPYRSFAH
jgi:hypothetical protein